MGFSIDDVNPFRGGGLPSIPGLGSGGTLGSLAGGGLGLGTLLGMGWDASKAAQQAQDDAIAQQQGLTQAEIARRQNNIKDIKAMYGESAYVPVALRPDKGVTQASLGGWAGMAGGPMVAMAAEEDPAEFKRYETAQRMGAKLNADINEQAGAARELGTQQNLYGTSAALTQANAAAASTGTTGGSVAKRDRANIMGGYLQGRQNIATGAEGVRTSAKAALDADKNALMQSAAGGSLDIDPTLAAQKQAGALNSARANVPMNTMGSLLSTGAGYAVNSSQANTLGYNQNPNYFGASSLSSGQTRTPGQFVQTR